MIVRLFGMMGTLAHEKRPVWYEPLPDTQCSALAYEATVEIPEDLQPYKNTMDETVITINGDKYMLNDLLGYGEDDAPVIRWHDGRYPHTIKLTVIK